MKIRVLVQVCLITLLSTQSIKAQFQPLKIGDAAEKVKAFVEMQTSEYYQSQGDHSATEDYKVIMDNGNVSQVILQVENTADLNLQRAVSFRYRYIMKSGKLNRVLKEYFNVSIEELKAQFKKNYQGNKINEYGFNEDYSVVTMVYLGQNHLATEESKPTNLNDFPNYMREIIEKDQNQSKLAEQKKVEQPIKGNQGINTDFQSQGNFSKVDRESEFPGGVKAMYKFLSDSLNYPENAYKNKIEGQVLLRFVIEKDGSVADIEIANGEELGYGLAKEAKRVVLLMPKWIPAMQGADYIKSYKTLPINFRRSN